MNRDYSPPLLVVSLLALLSACADTPENTTAAKPAQATAATPPPPVAIPFLDAVRKAARDVLSNAGLSGEQQLNLVIDPLVDGNAGVQTVATADMERVVVDIIQTDFRQLAVKPFKNEIVAGLPLIMVGTFTPINLQGKADGERNAYRICFALANLKSGKIISKGLARSLPEGFDPTPLPLFRDMPVWSKDAAVDGYIKTCQGTKAGDPINPAYIDAIVAASAINEAASAYNSKRYRDSLALYQAALKNPAGNQARVHAGIYLNQQRSGRKPLAMKAFATLAEMGLNTDRLAIRFNFAAGASAFLPSQHPYNDWLREISRQALRGGSCLEVSGHSRRSSSAQLDERLSLQRAEFVRQKMLALTPALAKRSTAVGHGSRQVLVGIGSDDDADALDQRIEFRKISC